MKIAFQIDPIEKLKLHSDSSLALMESALSDSNEVFFYYPQSLSLLNNKIMARVYKLKSFNIASEPHFNYEPTNVSLYDMNIILLRQDPPFDMSYITSTFLLEKLMDKVLILNNPISVRNSPEKLLVTNFSHLMPKTLISRDYDYINDFLQIHKKCVIKPLYGNAGSDVFYLDINDFNAKSLIQYFLHTFAEQVIIQEFLPNVSKGDKRIMLVDGEPLGFFHRIPASGEIKSNLAAGGKAVLSPLTNKEIEICNELKPTLQKLGLFFVGIDVIDNMLTEINVTSPTGLRSWENLSGENLANKVIAKMKELYKKTF